MKHVLFTALFVFFLVGLTQTAAAQDGANRGSYWFTPYDRAVAQNTQASTDAQLPPEVVWALYLETHPSTDSVVSILEDPTTIEAFKRRAAQWLLQNIVAKTDPFALRRIACFALEPEADEAWERLQKGSPYDLGTILVNPNYPRKCAEKATAAILQRWNGRITLELIFATEDVLWWAPSAEDRLRAGQKLVDVYSYQFPPEDNTDTTRWAVRGALAMVVKKTGNRGLQESAWQKLMAELAKNPTDPEFTALLNSIGRDAGEPYKSRAAEILGAIGKPDKLRELMRKP